MNFDSQLIKFYFKPNTSKIAQELKPQGDHQVLTLMKPSSRENKNKNKRLK